MATIGSDFDPAQFGSGVWHIVRSTLAMWHPDKGKVNPCLIYDKYKNGTWRDTVRFSTASGNSGRLKETTIVGKDTLHVPGSLRDFKWRGAGLLMLVTCPCKVLDNDPRCEEFAVVHFKATLFTQEGIDIVFRSASVTDEQVQAVLARPALQAPHIQKLLTAAPLLVPIHSSQAPGG